MSFSQRPPCLEIIWINYGSERIFQNTTRRLNFLLDLSARAARSRHHFTIINSMNSRGQEVARKVEQSSLVLCSCLLLLWMPFSCNACLDAVEFILLESYLILYVMDTETCCMSRQLLTVLAVYLQDMFNTTQIM